MRTDLPGITMILPGYNEERTILGSVRSALAQHYPNLEVIVVNDGSTDAMVAVLVAAYRMEKMEAPIVAGPIHHAPIRAVYRSPIEPRLMLLDKQGSGGKADGCNAAFNYATMPWCVVMDADELVGDDVLLRCMTEVLHSKEEAVAVGVTLLPTNGCKIRDMKVIEPKVSTNPWVGFQTIEYLGAFAVSRPGMSRMNAMPIVSGGFGVFRRDIIFEVGGFKHPSLGEDLEMVVRINRKLTEAKRPYVILQVPEAVVWTEFPSTATVLRRQRMRWHRGLREVLREHRKVIANPTYGPFGMLGMTQMLMFEWCAALIEAFGYLLVVALILTVRIRPNVTVAMWSIAQALGMCISMSAVWAGSRYIGKYKGPRDAALLVMWAGLAQFGFRQLTLVWRMRSLFGNKTAWGAMPRDGFSDSVNAAPVALIGS